jgi:hypothetical protein
MRNPLALRRLVTLMALGALAGCQTLPQQSLVGKYSPGKAGGFSS